MSEGMIIRRGGGASLKATDALLRVQAPAGSTVTISKGTTTKTDLGHENALDPTMYDYYFIIHQSQFDSVNPWTVTATDGMDTVTETVIIDAADEYDVQIVLVRRLFWNGDKCTSITGGWSYDGWGTIYGTVTFEDDLMKMIGNGSGSTLIATVNPIDVTNYSKLVYKGTRVSAVAQYGNVCTQMSGLYSRKDPGTSAQVITYNENGTGPTDKALDISSLTGSYYVVCRVGNHDLCRMNWSEIYLEP